jgi:hypothetical protein
MDEVDIHIYIYIYINVNLNASLSLSSLMFLNEINSFCGFKYRLSCTLYLQLFYEWAHTIKLIKLVKLVINFVCNLCSVHYNIIILFVCSKLLT